MTRIGRRSFLWGATAAATALGIEPLRAQPATQVPPASTKPAPRSSGVARPSPSEQAAMDAVASGFRQQNGIPGLSVAVAQAGVPVYVRTFGVSNNQGGVPLQPTDVLRIAGISKSVTATAIFTLVEQRRLSLNDLVFGGPNPILGAQAGGPMVAQITIDNLLTHTAGGWEAGPNDPMFMNTRMSPAELISWTLQNVPLQNPPGSTFAVSNFGYCVLGRVIDRVTGSPYASYVQQSVLSRCGINTMRIGGATLSQRFPDEVVYYGQPGEKPIPYEIPLNRMDADDGWVASPSDLVAFASHLNRFPSRLNILKPQTTVQMTTGSPANPAYGRGWEVSRDGTFWHHGALPGTTGILVHARNGVCWAALANTHQPNGSLDTGIDQMMWQLVRQVRAWRL
jgi:CubicO group peptidase (beta-lactamase class C family)